MDEIKGLKHVFSTFQEIVESHLKCAILVCWEELPFHTRTKIMNNNNKNLNIFFL